MLTFRVTLPKIVDGHQLLKPYRQNNTGIDVYSANETMLAAEHGLIDIPENH